MGVPLLLTWLRKKFAPCFLPAATRNNGNHCAAQGADNLYIDLNSLLYQSAALVSQGAGTYGSVDDVEDAVLRKVFDLLDDIIFNLVLPTALVYLAVDGVSPLGKMAQQRTRRRRSAHRTGSRGHHHGYRQDRGNMEELWDSNCISVGTRFMAKATEALHFYAASRTEQMNTTNFADAQEKTRARAAATVTASSSSSPAGTLNAAAEPFRPISIVVDDVLRPGEGENKISEAIRCFRAQPGYNANTSHVICSSDTDVTVSSLILHEPRIHVLRYEPPTTTHHHSHSGGGGGNQQQDSWLSTFFSIHLFREKLREVLGLADPNRRDAASDAVFEKALHDVVFVMLLFGNDFLPTIGGHIKEGTLDSLLELLASDFVSRGRTIVDPMTNHIQFTEARYLLDCLADIRGVQEVLSITANGAGGDGDWGFDADPQFQARKARRDKQVERKCYCYWTMLQWALQYSAGVVDHWGCYYPFHNAPPLYMLRKYCGVMSYEGLVQLAQARHTLRAEGAHKNAPVSMDEDDDIDLPDLPEQVTQQKSTPHADRGRPTDVMVQLLVLMPERSMSLLPTVFRNSYKEVEEAVQAPVDRLDLGAIGRWCESKRAMLSEEERTRFGAYQLFSQSEPLPICNSSGVVNNNNNTATTVGTPTDGSTEQTSPPLLASAVVFLARWPIAESQQELSKIAAAAVTIAVSHTAEVKQQALDRSAKAASFFGARRGKPSAAAALLAASAVAAVIDEDDQKEGETTTTTTTTATTVSLPPQEATQDSNSSSVAVLCSGAASTEIATATGINTTTTTLVEANGAYVFVCAPCSLLQDSTLIRSMGMITGTRFTVGTYKEGLTLSRNTQTQRARLRWELSMAPEVLNTEHAAGLLPGYVAPEENTFMDTVREKRREEGDRVDPWKALEKTRKRQHPGEQLGDATDSGSDDGRKEEGVARSSGAESAEDELLRRKEDVRRRLEMLKAAKAKEGAESNTSATA